MALDAPRRPSKRLLPRLAVPPSDLWLVRQRLPQNRRVASKGPRRRFTSPFPIPPLLYASPERSNAALHAFFTNDKPFPVRKPIFVALFIFYRRSNKQTVFSDGAFDRSKKILDFSRALFVDETLDGKRGNYRDKERFPTPRGAASNTTSTRRKRKKKSLQENKIC